MYEYTSLILPALCDSNRHPRLLKQDMRQEEAQPPPEIEKGTHFKKRKTGRGLLPP